MSVTATAVLKWVRQYAIENYEKPKPQTNTTAVVVELDEVWHYLQRKKTSFGFGRLIVVLPIGSLTGSVGVVMAELFSGCLVGFIDGM
jgi:hypothetical protein